jgi:MtN3 and saliva related transmembrane protein
MKFEIFDDKVSLTTNIFLIIANIINLIYNIPQVWKTFRTKSTKDFSETFLVMRILGNTIWIGYAIEINSMLMLINNLVVIFSTMFLGYYKVLEIIKKRKIKAHSNFINNNTYTNINNDNEQNENYTDIDLDNNNITEKDKLIKEIIISL